MIHWSWKAELFQIKPADTVGADNRILISHCIPLRRQDLGSSQATLLTGYVLGFSLKLWKVNLMMQEHKQSTMNRKRLAYFYHAQPTFVPLKMAKDGTPFLIQLICFDLPAKWQRILTPQNN